MSTKKRITKILIANRGEIASRVIETCKKMNIETVAIFAEDDKNLPYVKEATESYLLGTGTLAETYLNSQLILDIAKLVNADAIHPGYGFLSENSLFRNACQSAGVQFIGPSPEAMELMGDKQASKIALEKSGAPLIPGYHGDNQEPEFLKSQASQIGFPILIKASAGGGGKGMRIVKQLSEFNEALASAKREALKAFSNDNVLIEKYILNPRHIEVQVMGDSHGNMLHFFERECSIQRRYQKIIEETPAPSLSDELRGKICQSAVDIASSINYENAGTIEFILDSRGDFYFLEMNTRLQVEHPVTEMVTGHDLVEWQIKVAQGEELSIKQTDITQTGHAIECRIYAENADSNFMPSVGIIESLEISFEDGVRWDASYEQGNEVTINYDPMIGKLITYDINRERCISKMNRVLNNSHLLGFKANHNYLLRILSHPKFVEADIDTLFIEKYSAQLEAKKISNKEMALIIARTYTYANKMNMNSSPWQELADWRIDS